MANHDREKERLARRDIARFRVALANHRVGIPELLMLQRACDKLAEVLEKRAERRLLKDPLKRGEDGRFHLPISNRWFHGTDAGNVNSILEKGLQPRKERATNHPDLPSHPDMVYITDAYGLYYAWMADRHILECHDHDSEKCAVFEICLRDVWDGIHADEDALDQQGKPIGVIDREMTPDEFNKDVVFRSLYYCGIAAFKGTITPNFIKRFSLVPTTHPVMGAIASSEGTRGYCIREQQRAITQWIMDGGEFPVPPEEVMISRKLADDVTKQLKMSLPAIIAAGVRGDTLLRRKWMLHPITDDGIVVTEIVVTDNEEDAAKMEDLGGMLVAQKEVAMPAAT